MAKINKRLFAFLKDRKIFTRGGDRTFRAWLNAKEMQTENNDRARKPRKKVTFKH